MWRWEEEGGGGGGEQRPIVTPHPPNAGEERSKGWDRSEEVK